MAFVFIGNAGINKFFPRRPIIIDKVDLLIRLNYVAIAMEVVMSAGIADIQNTWMCL